ncbi:MAG: hypothetical protein K0R21_1236 [Anaerocolumna sp.]|jgi:hypothetical protein|nr:hypothetical protein [Anaerocolumna sp.]
MIPTAAIGRPTGCATPTTYPVSKVEDVSKTEQIINMVLDGVQTFLDVVGLIPAVGEPADAANAAIYTARGDYANAALSAAACIPIVGSLGTTAKLVNKGSQVVETVVDGAKIIDNLVDSSKIVDKVNDAGKAVDNISDVSKGIDATKQTSNVASEVIEGGLETSQKLLNVGTKSDAIASVKNLPEAIQSKVKDFYRGGSNAYNNFAVEQLENGNYLVQMTKPGNVPGSYATYFKEITEAGETVITYKNTIDPLGNLVHTKIK